MKTIIAGSRSITDPRIVEVVIARSGFEITEVVSGRAPGVDTLGEEWAKAHGIRVEPFPALWRVRGAYNPLAGHERNQRMVNYADALIAIHDGISPGTLDCLRRAVKKGLRIWYEKVSMPDPQSTLF